MKVRQKVVGVGSELEVWRENVLTQPPVPTLLPMFRCAHNVNSPLVQICAIILPRTLFPKSYGFISRIQLVKSQGKSKKKRHFKQQIAVTRKVVGHEKTFITVAK